MHIAIHKISNFYQGKSEPGSEASEVFEVILENPRVMRVVLLTYGAAICRLEVPNRNGLLENIVLGYDDYCDYLGNPLYAGATLAPAAGRLSQASLPIDGRSISLSANDDRHQLHGGFHSASFQNWSIASFQETSKSCSVTFTLSLPDKLDGFPGNRTLFVCCTLRDDLSLELHYRAVTDRTTYFNLSNHSYFNLSGDFTRSGLEQELQIYAGRYLANDAEHIPTASCACADTPFDYREPISLLSQMQAYSEHSQLKNARGYNNAFLLDSYSLQEMPDNPKHPPVLSSGIQKALSLKDNASGRSLTLRTDAPCIVLYSGGYIDGSHTLAGHIPSSGSCALALEAQDIPDVPHIAPAQYRLTAPGETFQRTILLTFS